jgi:hypothetical protein
MTPAQAQRRLARKALRVVARLHRKPILAPAGATGATHAIIGFGEEPAFQRRADLDPTLQEKIAESDSDGYAQAGCYPVVVVVAEHAGVSWIALAGLQPGGDA